MNSYEKKMLEILREGREHYGVLATKAEFEAEGTRTDELLRLLEIANKADVGLALKVGGCEAVRDMLEAKQFGVRYIIAPMVETPYALSKYIAAKDKVYSSEEQKDVSFLFNLETITAFNNLVPMLELAANKPGCDGVVFGRVDFSGSIGAGRDGIESEPVTQAVESAAKACSKYGLDFVVGGAVQLMRWSICSVLRRSTWIALKLARLCSADPLWFYPPCPTPYVRPCILNCCGCLISVNIMA